MTQMSTAAARVIDPVLSTVAQGYTNADLVGSALFPIVDVVARAGRVIRFGKESFFAYDTARAPGSATKRLQIGYGSDQYSLVDHALAGVVPRELLEEAEAVPGINLGSATVRTVMAAHRLRLEIQQAAMAQNAANYDASHKTTLSGTSQWSDLAASDPIDDIEVAKEAIRADTGKRPTVVLMGSAVWSKLKQNAKIVERVKYTGRDVPTPELVAELFGVQRVVIGEAITSTDAGVFSDVWGKTVIVAFTETSPLSDHGVPTYGYTYQLRGYPFVEPAAWDRDTKSWIYDVSDAVAPVIAAPAAGYLISAAVA